MRHTAYLLLLVTMLLWGGNSVAGKLAVDHVSPMLLNTLRWLLATMVMVVLAREKLPRDWLILKQNWLLFLFYGGAGMTGFGIALYGALLYTTAINTSIVQASMPLIVFVANFLIFAAPIAGAQVAGFLISLVGVAIVVSHGELARLLALDVNIGDAIILAGVMLYGLYTVTLRFRPQMSWQSFMLAIVASGLLTSLPFSIGEYFTGHTIWPVTAQGVGVSLYAGLLPSLIAQIFFIRGVELIGPNRAGLFINLVPIFGTLLSILILGENFHVYHAVAIAMVLGGIALAERKAA